MTAPDVEPVTQGSTVSAPVVIYSPNPDLSPEVIEGSKDEKDVGLAVTLIVTVTSKGDVAAARIANGPGKGFDQKTLALVFMSKFRPATKDGKPVRTEVGMRVRLR